MSYVDSPSQPAGPRTEAWLRGPIPGIDPAVQPVAHALIQALEEIEQVVIRLDPSILWSRPGNAASIGFHIRHMAGSLDRLLTYARGEVLSEAQREALRKEREPDPDVGPAELLGELAGGIQQALAQLERTRPEELDTPRRVGRAGLPSSVRGLLHHAGEHTARHAGQVITTARVLEGS
jgi:uncharacterized damage-inducible protein DinB